MIGLRKWMMLAVLSVGCVNGSAEAELASPKSKLVQSLEVIFYAPDFVTIPAKVFKAEDYGVTPDGKTINTKSLQAAIDAAHEAGGGMVTLPQGLTVSGALFLKSNVELRLDEGVVLQAVQDNAEFPEKWTRIAGIEMDWPTALINVYEQENVRITGKGIIDGNGKYWWDKFWGDPQGKGGMMPEYERRGLRWALDYDCKRVRPIVIYKSKDVLLKDFTVKRAGFWTITTTYSDRVHIDGVTIRNNIGGHGPSTDGVDIDSSSHILVENCDVDCNDDNFCIKSGRDSDGLRVNRPSEYIVIRNCKTGKGHGLVTLGSETSGGMNHIEIYGLKAKGTGTGFRLKSAKIRGGVIRNIYIHDIEMDGVATPFRWELNWFPSYSYPPRPKDVPESEWPAHWKVMLTEVTPPERGIPEFYNIRISNVKAINATTAIYANAYPEKPLRDVVWENVVIQAKSGGQINHAKNWTMTHVTLQSASQVQLKNCTNVQLPLLEQRPRFWDPVPPSPSTTLPGEVNDDYWHSEFERVNKAVAKADGSQVVFFGDSITLSWSMVNAEGKAVWEDRFAKYKPINMGNSGDITPVMLYRITNGNLDFAEGQAPHVAVLLCGTNNYAVTQSDGGKEQWDLGIEAPPGEVADGVRAIAQEFRRKLPATRVIVLGILPVKDGTKWKKCRETNRILASYHYPKDEVVFMDLEDRFLNGEGSIRPELFKDGTHLTPAGYKVMADALVPQIERLIGLGPVKSSD